MKILGIETSASACSVGILAGQNIVTKHQIAPMQQTKLVLPLIQTLLNETSLSLTDLDAIAFGCGPGSFTGIRIAASVTQGLAFGANLPVIPISSLAVLAQTAWQETKASHVFVALDARMNEIYGAEYKLNNQNIMEVVGKEHIIALNALEPFIGSNAIPVGIGDAWEKYPQILINYLQFQPQLIHSTIIPNVSALLWLAQHAYQQGHCITADKVNPNYLR